MFYFHNFVIPSGMIDLIFNFIWMFNRDASNEMPMCKPKLEKDKVREKEIPCLIWRANEMDFHSANLFDWHFLQSRCSRFFFSLPLCPIWFSYGIIFHQNKKKLELKVNTTIAFFLASSFAIDSPNYCLLACIKIDSIKPQIMLCVCIQFAQYFNYDI